METGHLCSCSEDGAGMANLFGAEQEGSEMIDLLIPMHMVLNGVKK